MQETLTMASARPRSSSSEDEQKIARLKHKRPLMNPAVCSSDEESIVQNVCRTPLTNDNDTTGRRHSQRKRQRKFRMPSREEQWNEISTATATHCLSHLKPRKLVNDFTKVTHRYNYDYVEVSGEESMDEFIADTDANSSETDSNTSESESKSKAKRKHRVKGYRPRIATVSDSSEENGETGSACLQETAEENTGKQKSLSSGDNLPKQNTPMQQDSPSSNTADLRLMKSAQKSSKKQPVLDSDSDCELETSSVAKENTREPTSSKPELVSHGDSQIQTSSFGSHSARTSSGKKRVLDSDSDSQSETTSYAGRNTGKSTKRKSALDSDSDDSNPTIRCAAKSARKKLSVDSDSDSQNQTPSSLVLAVGRRNTKAKRHPDDKTDHCQLSEPEENLEIKTPRKRTKSALDSDSDYEPADSETRDTKNENQQENSQAESSCPNRCKTSTTSDSTSFGKSSYSKDSEGKDVNDETSESDDESEGSHDDSKSETSDQEGRIQKLAKKKKQDRQKLFSQLKSARAKQKQKT